MAAVVALAVGLLAFFYRFNTLGGALGGFDNDHFTALMRTLMLAHGERPLRDFSDAGLSGAWPALTYLLPLWAQSLAGPNLLSEAYLTAGLLAAAYALVFVLALALSRNWPTALLAAATAVATGPKLYNYSKVLALACGALAIRSVALNPTAGRLAAAAAVTAVAALFRHDYAVYIGVGMVAALLARDPRQVRVTLLRLLQYGGCTAVLLLPTAAFVHLYRGIPEYLQAGLEASQIESRRTHLQWPVLELALPLTNTTLLALSYYLFWVLVAIGAAVAAVRLGAKGAFTPLERATGSGLLALAAIVNLFFLRGNLGQRFGDAIVPTVLVAAWSVGAAAAMRPSRARRGLMAAAPVLLGVMLIAIYRTGEVDRELETAAIFDSREHAQQRFDAVRRELRALPPADWAQADTGGTLAAARYVAACTAADDYLLVGAYAPEIPVFARRRFAAGQPIVSLSFYTSDADQRRAIDRLRHQSVPIILTTDQGYDEEFRSDYPLLAQYVELHYRLAGTIATDADHQQFRVYVDQGRTAVRNDPALGLPCFR